MAWVRLDDRFDDSRKVQSAFNRAPIAVSVFVMAITYCARHETDGLVDAAWLKRQVPAYKSRRKALEVLVSEGLFEPENGGGYRIHDYLDYQPSRKDLEAKRAADAERKARGRASRVRDVSARTPAGIRAESARPIPSHPLTTDEQQAVHLVEPASEPACSPEVERLCELFSETARARTETPPSSPRYRVTATWRTEMDRLLRIDGRSPAEVEAVIRWVDRDVFWAGNVLSVPKLRSKYDQLRAAARRGQSADRLGIDRMREWAERLDAEGASA